MTFDPDKYLVEKSSQPDGGFDPDKYLNEKYKSPEASSNPLTAFGEGAADTATFGWLNNIRGATEPLVFGALNAITGDDVESDDYIQARDGYEKRTARLKEENPNAYLGGQVAGGIAQALALAPIATANGLTAADRIQKAARIGAAMGAAQNTGNVEGEISHDLSKVIKNTFTGGLVGLGAQGLGEAGSKIFTGSKKIGERLQDMTATKENADEIAKAAETLGTKATPGMLKSDYIERLESGLAESPSFFGESVKKNISDVYGKSQGAVDDLLQDATNLSPYQLGEKVKSGMSAKVAEDLGPSSMVFNDIAEQTKNIPLSQRGVSAIQKNISNLDDVALIGLKGKPAEYVDALGRVKNVDQLKKLATMLDQDIRATTGSEKSVLISIKEKIRAAEEANIMRAAKEMSKATGTQTPMNAGQDMVSALGEARTDYASKMGSYRDLAEKSRLGDFQGSTGFLDKIDSIPSEKVGDKLFNIANESGLASMQKTFPEQYGLLRQGALKDFQDSILRMDEVSLAKFKTQFSKLNPETQNRLFGQGVGKAQAVGAISDNLPRNFNPSGTTHEAKWNDIFMSNAKDIPKYAAYKMLSSDSARKMADKMISGSASMAEMSKTSPTAFANMVNSLSMKSGFKENQTSESTPQMENQDRIIEILGQNPQLLNSIQNPELRKQLEMKLQQKTRSGDAKKNFVEEN